MPRSTGTFRYRYGVCCHFGSHPVVRGSWVVPGASMRVTKTVQAPFGFMMLGGRKAGVGLGSRRAETRSWRRPALSHCIAGSYLLWEIVNVFFNGRDDSCSIGRWFCKITDWDGLKMFQCPARPNRLGSDQPTSWRELTRQEQTSGVVLRVEEDSLVKAVSPLRENDLYRKWFPDRETVLTVLPASV